MSTFSDTFTQGGQTQLHKLRMIQQVMGATLKGGIWIFIISLVALLAKDHSWQDFWFLGCYAKAYLRTELFSFLPDDFWHMSWIVNRDGSVKEVYDSWIMYDDFIHRVAGSIFLSTLKKIGQSFLITFVSLIIISWFWVVMGRKKQETKILSGFKLVSEKILKKQVLKQGASSYSIGSIPLPKNAEFQHMMITGTTGAGKSNMIHHLLQQIRRQGDQAIIVDTTSGLFSRFYKEGYDMLLNPLDVRSQNWNMWGEFKNDYILDEITEALIPDSRTLDSFWTQGARQVFGETVKFLKETEETSYRALMSMALKLPLKDFHKRLEGTIVASLMDPAIDKTALSIRASLAQSLKSFDVLQDGEDGFSFLDFLGKNTNEWLFLSCQPSQREFLKPLFSAWVSIIIKGIMARSEQNTSRTWIIIDELASLNRLPSLLTGLAEVRKYGGCFVLGFQDLSQLDDLYGHAATKTLSNLTGTKILFRCVDAEMATRMSKYFGEQEKQEASESISFGAHQMRDGVSLANKTQSKPLVAATQLMMLKDLQCFLKFPGDLPITQLSIPYLKLPMKNDGFVRKIDPV